MKKVLQFVDKYITAFKIAMCVLLTACLFLPLYYCVPKYGAVPPNYVTHIAFAFQNISFINAPFSLNAVSLFKWFSLFMLVFLVSTIILLIMSIKKTHVAYLIAACSCSAAATLCTCLAYPFYHYQANIDWSSSYHIYPHIGFVVLILLDVCFIGYTVYRSLKKR